MTPSTIPTHAAGAAALAPWSEGDEAERPAQADGHCRTVPSRGTARGLPGIPGWRGESPRRLPGARAAHARPATLSLRRDA